MEEAKSVNTRILLANNQKIDLILDKKLDNQADFYYSYNFCKSLLSNCYVINTSHFVPAYINDHAIEQIGSILNKLKNNEPKIFVFENKLEGFQSFDSYHKIIKYCIENYNFNLDDFLILSGAYPCDINVEFYKKLEIQFGLLPVKTILANTLELGYVLLNCLNNYFVLQNHLEYNIKTKKVNFLMYNGSERPHRMYFLGELFKRNLIDNNYITAFFDNNYLKNLPIDSYIHEFRDNLKELQQNYNKFPLRFQESDNRSNIQMWHLMENEFFHYNDARFGISSETKFFHTEQKCPREINERPHFCIACSTCYYNDQIFITEKTYKLIAGKLPFIILGFTNTLQVLREAGYKTFYPYINESYDNIVSDYDRLQAIAKEVERLCNFTDSEWEIFAENVLPIIKHNQEQLFKVKPKYIVLNG